jgi:hypothetical protein
MNIPRSLRLLPAPAALIVAAVCAYVPLGLYDLWHPEVFDRGNPDMTGAVAVLVGMAFTVGALVAAPALLLVFTLGTVRVRAGSRRWHGALMFVCVPGVLLDVPLLRAALSSDTIGSGVTPSLPVWHSVLFGSSLLLYAAGSTGCAVALLLPQTYRYLRRAELRPE